MQDLPATLSRYFAVVKPHLSGSFAILARHCEGRLGGKLYDALVFSESPQALGWIIDDELVIPMAALLTHFTNYWLKLYSSAVSCRHFLYLIS